MQEQINRILGDGLGRTGEESNLTPWAPAVDIYETENGLVVKADLPDVNRQTSTSASRTTSSRSAANVNLKPSLTTTTTFASSARTARSVEASRWRTA